MYYRLETRSWDAAKALDRVVQNYLLGPDVARKDLVAFGVSLPALPVPVDLSPDGAVSILPVDSLEDRTVGAETPQDSGAFSTFDVLFHENRQLARRHRSWYLFGSVVPERVRIDLVVEASEGYTRALHGYLARADLELRNRRPVNYATFSAESTWNDSERIEQFINFIEEIAEKQYPEIQLQTSNRFDSNGDGRGNLLAHGPISDVVAFRRTVLRSGLPAGVRSHDLTFEEHAQERVRRRK